MLIQCGKVQTYSVEGRKLILLKIYENNNFGATKQLKDVRLDLSRGVCDCDEGTTNMPGNLLIGTSGRGTTTMSYLWLSLLTTLFSHHRMYLMMYYITEHSDIST
jgi:hypothetical protein